MVCSSKAGIRARLTHPVIDSDGHLREFMPVALEYISKVAGRDMAEGLKRLDTEGFSGRRWYSLSESGRRDARAKRPVHWNFPASEGGFDHATSLFPDLLYSRLDEMGLDFTVLYPTVALLAQAFHEDEVRQVVCRGLNHYYADVWGGHRDRMAPVAAIPMHTPEEAIAELEHAVLTLGIRVVVMPSWVKRPIPEATARHPGISLHHSYWMDTYGLDSEYDYDPVWKKCEELGVVPSFHGGSEGFDMRRSISNTVYNHMGHFAAAGDALCKSLFLGGVTRRFPRLRFLFLEGGVGWARTLLGDLATHWDKRRIESMRKYFDPKLLDADLLSKLYQQYGGKLVRDNITRDVIATLWQGRPGDPADHFAGLDFSSKGELRQAFVEPFYFGCEGDDPVMTSAFDARRNPGGLKLNALYGSDIGHWDVLSMSKVLEEAYEPVDEGLLSAGDFRRFVFSNPVRLWTALNPDFFKGTVVEAAAREDLAGAGA